MIGRKTTKRLAEFAVQMFSRPTGQGRTYIPHGSVYDFAFEHDFDKHFCNAAEDRAAGSPDGRGLSEFIMQIHTGESVKRMRPKEPPVALEAEGQGYLRHLAEALLLTSEGSLSNTEAMHLVVALNLPDRRMALVRALELDGYVFRDGKLLHTESSIVDIEQQHSALKQLVRDLGFSKRETLERFLDLSEKFYAEGHWEDCIGNARKFLEGCLQESASLFNAHRFGSPLPPGTYDNVRQIREYLEKHKLLADREAKTIGETYGLLSNVGSHPNMAANDQARLLRQVALLYSEFVMLRVRGEIPQPGIKPAAS